jgi:flagellar biosynthesis anti-sigma factor FlgM
MNSIEGIGPTATPLLVDSVITRVSNVGPTATQNAPGAQAAQVATEDWTTFHSDRVSVLSLTSKALTSPEVRQGTVDALRQSIDGGQYQVDAAKIASAISHGGGE